MPIPNHQTWQQILRGRCHLVECHTESLKFSTAKLPFAFSVTSGVKLIQLGEGFSHTEMSWKWKPFKRNADFCIIFVMIPMSAKTQVGLGLVLTVPVAVQISRSSCALCTIWELQMQVSKTGEMSCCLEILLSFHGLLQKPPLPLKMNTYLLNGWRQDKTNPTPGDVKPQQNWLLWTVI